MIDVIAFDADDTLWHNESLYHMTQERFRELLAPYELDGDVDAKLFETEMRNLNLFGYGAKGFMLSMIETAIELTGGRICGREIQQIIDAVKQMLRSEIGLLDHVATTIPALAARYPLMIITKGDLFDQESKIARSGLADFFRYVEVVSHKDEATYRALLARHGIDPRRLLMVGNSLRSDILPLVALGAHAVHIPYHITWEHEAVAAEDRREGYHELPHMGELPGLVALPDRGAEQ